MGASERPAKSTNPLTGKPRHDRDNPVATAGKPGLDANSARMGPRIAPHPFEQVIGHFDSYKWPERLWSDWPPSTGKRMVVPMVSQLAFSPVILCPKITSSEKMSFGR